MTAPKSKTFQSGPAIAARFQRRLENKGISAQELALQAGCPLSVVEAILSGRSAEVELPDLQALIVELGGDVEELMESDRKDA
jgi:transcriptional regulator with XRE-family HTH domain